jgi:hypothetical protein
MTRVCFAAILVLICAFQGHAAIAAQSRPQPVLGDTLTTWEHDFGKYAGLWEWLPCANDKSTDQIQGNVQDGRVFSITPNYCTSAVPSVAARMKMAAPYIPADAHYLGQHSYEGTTSRVYFSARLASETGFKPGQFLPADFKACGPGFNAVMARTTTIVDGMAKAGIFILATYSDGYGTWELSIGTCA